LRDTSAPAHMPPLAIGSSATQTTQCLHVQSCAGAIMLALHHDAKPLRPTHTNAHSSAQPQSLKPHPDTHAAQTHCKITHVCTMRIAVAAFSPQQHASTSDADVHQPSSCTKYRSCWRLVPPVHHTPNGDDIIDVLDWLTLRRPALTHACRMQRTAKHCWLKPAVADASVKEPHSDCSLRLTGMLLQL
jgi:hypothetical protein